MCFTDLTLVVDVDGMTAEGQKHGVPALLSFLVPALGQLIKGEVLRAVGVFVLMAVSTALIFIGVGVITTPIIYLWQIYDAYNH